MPVKIRSYPASRAWEAMIAAICQGSFRETSLSTTWTPRSHPMARAFRIGSTTRSGPMERTVSSAPSPNCSRSLTASSTAYSSYSFMRQARSSTSYQVPRLSGLKRDSMSGTCLMQTRSFMTFLL